MVRERYLIKVTKVGEAVDVVARSWYGTDSGRGVKKIEETFRNHTIYGFLQQVF